jgi:hypothetical protein
MDLEEADRRAFGFKENQKSALDIVKSLPWLMSLWGPTLLAFDQLDPIVAQHHLASGSGTALDMTDGQRVSLSIIEGIGGGLMASVRSITQKTLNVVVCLEATWEILRNKSLQVVTDSFKEPQWLTQINQREIAQEIVTLRLRDAFQKVNFTPPYPSWPFKPESFGSAADLFPRQILKICEEHRQKCMREDYVTELSKFVYQAGPSIRIQDNNGWKQLDQTYEDLRREAPLQQLLAEDSEDETLGKLLQSACRCRIKESQFGEEVDAVVDAEFPGGKSYRSLHARLRLIYRKEGDREKHYCFRALQRSNAIAYQNRLKAAMTAAGIDRNLEFRHLIIVRSTPIPGGSATQSLTNKFRDAGGLSVSPSERPLRGLLIIDETKDLVPPGKSVPCKASILRLAAQARKYGLGLIFATQAPKSIDHNIIANCSTHYYGKANSPAAIDAIREQLKSRGGSGHDIATLKTGCFYVYTEGLQAPVKVSIPLCLSYHPASSLDETEVLKRAVRSHGLLFGLDKYQRFG